MKKLLSLALALCLVLSLGAAGAYADEAETGVWPQIAGENGTTYANLFEVILAEDCDTLWNDYVGAVVGEDAAADTVAALKGSISSELYGEDAIAAFADGGMAFDCWYINGVDTFTFAGDTATVNKTDGSSETHTYEYLGQYLIGEGEVMNYMGAEFPVAFPCDVYKSTDEAGEFNYFFFRDDTMDTTYHLEFRYGKDLEELQGYFVGPYAYWLAAGFDVDADQKTLENVVALFCLENMDYSGHSEGALRQLNELGIVGSWNADLSPFGEEFAGVELSMSIDENGHGITYMNGAKTRDFEAYALDNGEKGDGAGLYVAYDNEAMEAEAAPYTLTENEDGAAVLTLVADDGTISWVKAEAEALSFAGGLGTAEDPYLIETAEQLSAIRNDMAASYRLAADIDLAGAQWQPIGTFVPQGAEGEAAEMPDPAYAFTGTFDGDGHSISNLVIDQPEGYAIGLFGCIAGAKVENLTVANAAVDGSLMCGAVVGYSFDSFVSKVNLAGENTITGHDSETFGVSNMVGGVVGAGMDSVIADCTATADIVLGDGAHDAGIVGGGLEVTSVLNCSASGSITAGSGCFGLGGVSGCGFGSEAFTGCAASDVSISAGDDCRWIGGITGYAGGFEMEEAGVAVTVFTGCTVENVSVSTGENASQVGDIVGGGFFSEEAAAYYGAPFDAPTVYVLTDCTGSVTVNGDSLAA